MNELMLELREAQLKALSEELELVTPKISEQMFRMPDLSSDNEEFNQKDIEQQSEQLIEQIEKIAASSTQVGLKIEEIMAKVEFPKFSQDNAENSGRTEGKSNSFNSNSSLSQQ